MKEILEILESDARLGAEEIAVMLGMEKEEVQRIIKELEKNKVILKYHTLINREKTGNDKVMAMIEVRVAPQRNVGFDAVAERICRFPEVRSVRLFSGVYELAVFIEGKNIQEISNFVSTRLATIDGVLRTTTHFVLKTFKLEGVIFKDGESDRRLAVSP